MQKQPQQIPVKQVDSELNKWVYDRGLPQNANGQIDYERYGYQVAKPGPVISSKAPGAHSKSKANHNSMPSRRAQPAVPFQPIQQNQQDWMQPMA